MDNVTVNAHCSLTIDIKTFGEVNVVTDREALTTLQGTSLTVRSGSKVWCHLKTSHAVKNCSKIK